MSVRDFDKALQEKAQQLRLAPSPHVWAGVAEELNRKRRRRGAAWIFTTAALVAGFAVFVIGYQQYKNAPANDLAKKAGPAISQSSGKPGTSEKPQTGITNAEKLNPTRIDLNFTPTEEPASAGKKRPSTNVGLVTTDTKPPDLKIGEPVRLMVGLKQDSAKKQGHASIAVIRESKYKEEHNTIGTASNELLSEEPVHQARELLPVVIRGISLEQSQPLVNVTQGLNTNNQLTAELVQTKKLAKPDKWHTAIIFGAGAGSIVESGLQQYNTLANEYLGSVNIPSGIAAIQQRPSDVKSGPAFHLGGQVSRSLTRKLTVGIGFQYAYISNQITVGNSPDSTISIYNNRQQLVTNNVAYKAAGNSGTRYYNQFHFIQLPLEFNFGLGQKQRWHYSAGASIGYLVGIHALQYNSQAGVYYKDNEAYKKWQTTIFTGFQYTFSKANKIPFLVGPFAQYQLSSLDKTNTNKHLLMYGLSAKFQLR